MKRLLVFRHAKSSWDDPSLPDHERPLAKRGRKAAPKMGKLMAERGWVPERVLCSTAERARATAKRALEAMGYGGEVEYFSALYMASPDEMLRVVSSLDDDVLTAMLIGHNPGMEELVEVLTGAEERFPTAALAIIDLDVERWADASKARGQLQALVRPRELD